MVVRMIRIIRLWGFDFQGVSVKKFEFITKLAVTVAAMCGLDNRCYWYNYSRFKGTLDELCSPS